MAHAGAGFHSTLVHVVLHHHHQGVLRGNFPPRTPSAYGLVDHRNRLRLVSVYGPSRRDWAVGYLCSVPLWSRRHSGHSLRC